MNDQVGAEELHDVLDSDRLQAVIALWERIGQGFVAASAAVSAHMYSKVRASQSTTP